MEGNCIAELTYNRAYARLEKDCKGCKFSASFICNRDVVPDGSIEDYFVRYQAKIEVWEFPEGMSKKRIRVALNQLILKRHREGRYWALAFTNFHCADSTEKCQCFSDRCNNYDEVPGRQIPRCRKLWFSIPNTQATYRKENIAFVVA